MTIIIMLCSFTVIITLILIYCFTGFNKEYTRDNKDNWKFDFDISLPNLENAGSSEQTANSQGWFMTSYEDFN